ncbi:MAG: sulfatase-like hydrolase/transferase, partial [Thermoanaerobaculia bacterium]|nr:sulfatase-like hydrolase/transferase [Thermoanaerobaculia bacterium]
MLPPEHGVRDNLGVKIERVETLPFLPRRLQEVGYRTAAMVSTFVLRGNGGLATGFDFYDDKIATDAVSADLGSAQRPGGETLERALAWAEGVRHGRFFLFFHIYEPHTPYSPPEPFASRYPRAYDGEVAASDAIVGELLDRLREWGLYDRALIVLTSDHGEHLGDHGYQEHGPFLYREALQVPLLLKLPGGERAGAAVDTPARLEDVVPTVLALLGRRPPAGLPGLSLLTLADDPPARRTIYGETFYPRLHFGWSDLASIVDFPLHYIHGPDPELYHLVEDPGETVNLVRRERRAARELRDLLAEYDRELPAPGEVDPETRRRLAALGYLGGSAAATGDGPLPDPKARAHVLEEVRVAFVAFREGRYAEAAEQLERVLAQEPGLIDGWEHLGHARMRLGRVAEAVEAYRQAVERSGGAAHVALPAAAALLRLGRLEEARQHAEMAAPVIDAAHDLLAQIALRQGRLEEAEEHLERALATRAARIEPLITQADLRYRQQRFGEAVALAEQAEREAAGRPTDLLRGLDLVRGRAHAALGDAEAAEAAFRRELERAPDSLDAYTSLAYLYAVLGRGPEAGATLRRMVETNPRPAAYAAAVRTLRQMGDDRSAARVLQQARSRWPENDELAAL